MWEALVEMRMNKGGEGLKKLRISSYPLWVARLVKKLKSDPRSALHASLTILSPQKNVKIFSLNHFLQKQPCNLLLL